MTMCFSNRLATLLMVLALASCSRTESCCEGEDVAAAQPLSDTSIYQLDHAFVDQYGVARKLVDFSGQPVLIAMIFTNCSYACPAIVNDITRSVAESGADPSLKVVLVSMDVKRDQPEVLRKFAEERGLDRDRYFLLHGDDDAVAEVAAVLGVRFNEVDGGDFSHSNQVVLLNGAGEIHHRLQGLGVKIEPLVAAIKELL